MQVATAALIIMAVSAAFFLAVVLVQRARRPGISRHPYRDPYGDTPGASRGISPARDVEESIHAARGTR
jgi:hypothetical protein